MPALRAPQRALRPRIQGRSDTLTSEERATIDQGRLFRLLPPDLREAIVGRAYVWRLAPGEQVVPESGPISHWLGVASGELTGLTRSLETGEPVVAQLLSGGGWMTVHNPLSEISDRQTAFASSGASCLLALSREDLVDLWSRRRELWSAMLVLAAMNLRFAQLAMQESQVSTLEQKQLRWIDGMVHFSPGVPAEGGLLYANNVRQATLAAAAGVSRQSWNAGMARLEEAGLIRRVKGGLVVRDHGRLQAELSRQGLMDTASCLGQDVGPVRPAPPLPCEPMTIAMLREEEQSALSAMPWYERLSPASRDTLLSSVQVLRPREGDLLGKADCRPPGWLCVLRGGLRLVGVTRPPESGTDQAARAVQSRVVLARVQQGATLFEHALLDGGPCAVDVISEAATSLLMLPPEGFHALIEGDPAARLNALKEMCHGIHHIAMTRTMLTLPMPLRLHAWLDTLCRTSGRWDAEWVTLPMRLTQPEIAGWLSTTRQYVGRAIAQLEGNGGLVRHRDEWLLRCDRLPLAKARRAAAESTADTAVC
jgi:CRP/FNR family transcriptional regulator, cyclic AMP receptor protein